MSFIPMDLNSFWGMGYYTRSNTEFKEATKGKPQRISKSAHQLVW